ncbi:unnamed protein product [Effrenium voratum]|nr:unnamed protein product [Effrenium voratum]
MGGASSAANAGAEVRLRLRNVGLKKDGARLGLLALLKQKQWIVELNVELNPIGDLTSVFRLCGAVQSEKCWRTLNVACLGGNATSGVGAESTNLGTQLASCLSNATGLKDLDCSGNGLGDTGAKEMVKAMKCTDGLERLALNDSGCYILTATMLQAALGANAGSQAVLKALELRGNALNDDCITVLAEGLSQSISLEKLMLAKHCRHSWLITFLLTANC